MKRGAARRRLPAVGFRVVSFAELRPCEVYRGTRREFVGLVQNC